MNSTLIAPNAKVYEVVDMSNEDAENPINWKQCTFQYNGSVESLTIDKEAAKKIKPMQVYTLAIQIRESTAVSRNGKSAYKTHKFKIVDVQPS